MSERGWLTNKAVEFLTRPLPHYERKTWNDAASLERQIRKGDVLLVEGDSRVAAIIKYLTQSSWSHSALYIGDELLHREAHADRAREQFGDEAANLLIEALPEGVVVVPLSKYTQFNIRLLRPYRLRGEHLDRILDEAVASLGWDYDLRNILDLFRYFAVLAVAPARSKNRPHLGSRAPTEVICSSLIGQIFQRVGFPILPRIEFGPDEPPALRPPRSWKRLLRRDTGACGLYHRRHPTLLTPRDFDLSPYFEVVKFNVIAEGGFDYRKIRWAEELESPHPSHGEGSEGFQRTDSP